MKFFLLTVIFLRLFSGFIVTHCIDLHEPNESDLHSFNETIHLTYTACEYLHYGLSRGILGSITTNAQSHRIHLHLLLDDTNVGALAQHIPSIKCSLRDLTIYPMRNLKVNLPPQYTSNRFKCAFHRLFLSEILPEHVKRLLYVDTDTLILEDLDNLWKLWPHLKHKVFGGAQEVNQTANGTSPFGKQHFLRPTGINTGVLMMNLHRMRHLNLTGERLLQINDEPCPLADQDIINSYAYYNPDEIYQLECKWNKRQGSKCPDSSDSIFFKKDEGIMHGSGGRFIRVSAKLNNQFAYNMWAYYEDQITRVENMEYCKKEIATVK